ncbi:zf-HC2 domain-containing protein [Streptosporangiaceae bacterium NEAU-GS5]|nr:zf-HC2 domain-containing protein [Streptosporangiaceae bacterium NEAU-GS5]
MSDRVLVEALRARRSGALAALYDAYAERLYRYCLALAGSADAAQVALRDTMIAAEAHIGALADPESLRPWLYALARGECGRRRAAEAPDVIADGITEPVTIAVPPLDDPADADLRVVAWYAARGLSADDRELLDLATRHGLAPDEIARIVGRDPHDTQARLAAATERLRDTITVEMLARKGPHDCPRRARLLAGFAGELTPETRDQLARHVAKCETCRSHRAGQASAARVFGLLPAAVMPDTLRVRVMSCFFDPELVPYRGYVARRVGALDAAGFPLTRERRRRQWPQAIAGGIAAVAAAAAIALGFVQLAQAPEHAVGIASGAYPIDSGPAGTPPSGSRPVSSQPDNSPMTVNPPSHTAKPHPTHAPVVSVQPDPPIHVTAPAPTHAPTPVRPAPTHRPEPPVTSRPRPTPSAPPSQEPTLTPTFEPPTPSPSTITVSPEPRVPRRHAGAERSRPCDHQH